MSNDENLGYVAWDDGSYGFLLWKWGRVTKRTEKTVIVEQWREWNGGEFQRAVRKSTITDMVFFDNEADARALVKAMKELIDCENATRMQYRDKRKALVEAARVKVPA